MGYYIDKVRETYLDPKNKARQILMLVEGAKKADEVKFQPDLVCVVENGMFDAAGYCYDEREFEDFRRPDGRRRTWLIVPGAAELSRYKT